MFSLVAVGVLHGHFHQDAVLEPLGINGLGGQQGLLVAVAVQVQHKAPAGRHRSRTPAPRGFPPARPGTQCGCPCSGKPSPAGGFSARQTGNPPCQRCPPGCPGSSRPAGSGWWCPCGRSPPPPSGRTGTCPGRIPADRFSPSWNTCTDRCALRAFTTEAPTPCRPPDTL